MHYTHRQTNNVNECNKYVKRKRDAVRRTFTRNVFFALIKNLHIDLDQAEKRTYY